MHRSLRALRSIPSISQCASSWCGLSEASWSTGAHTFATAPGAATAQGQRMPHTLAQRAIAGEQPLFEPSSQPSAPQQPAPDRDESHARRLAELQRASRPRASSRPLPSVDEVAERLRSREGASCSSGPSSSTPAPDSAPEDPPLSWRSIVAALREGEQLPVDKARILTDSFRCASATCLPPLQVHPAFLADPSGGICSLGGPESFCIVEEVRS